MTAMKRVKAVSRVSAFWATVGAIMLVLVPGSVLAQTTMSAHEIAVGGCKGCHAPTSGLTTIGATADTSTSLEWARAFPDSNNTFGVYDSPTMKSKAAEIGGSALTSSTDARLHSLLCLSCHDGVTSSFSPAMNPAKMVGSRAFFGAGASESLGLANDHPVNMSYDPARNPSLQPVGRVTASLPLYGNNNTVQCATCHDPHNNSYTNYLRQPNNSAHCTTCHA
jgi:predicted CXXCH cytochrome family protein